MQKPKEHDIVVEGQLIHYYHAEPSGEKKGTLVFLHGWGSNSPLWFSSTVKLIEHGYELYYLDLPGFGKSSSPRHAFFLSDYAHIITQVMEKLEIEKPILVGHSFGGKIAVRITSKKHIPLAGMVLVDSSGLPHTSLITKVKIGIAKTVKPVTNLSFMQGVRSTLLRVAGSDDYVAFPEARETFVNIIREHVASELGEISLPTLVLWGGNDDNSYTPPSDATVFTNGIAGAHMKIIDQAGHYCFLDQPTIFFQALFSFVEQNYGKN